MSCDRSAVDRPQESKPPAVVEEIEDQPEVVKNTKNPENNSEVNQSKVTNGYQVQNKTENPETQDEEPTSDTRFTDRSSGRNWWMIGTIVSIGLNFILFGLLVKTINSKNEYKRQRNDIEIGKNKYKNEALRLSSKLDDLEKKKINVGRKPTNSPNPHNSPKKEQIFDDEKSHEVVWPVNNVAAKHTSQEVKQPVSLFAEKATEDSTFSSVSDQKNEHRTIFKLSLENEQAETAQFEVIDSDFILKMAANSPDTYLYTVCKPENSNQNFAGEIITVEKGIAHKVDGKWQVKDENKAKIKFQ